MALCHGAVLPLLQSRPQRPILLVYIGTNKDTREGGEDFRHTEASEVPLCV